MDGGEKKLNIAVLDYKIVLIYVIVLVFLREWVGPQMMAFYDNPVCFFFF